MAWPTNQVVIDRRQNRADHLGDDVVNGVHNLQVGQREPLRPHHVALAATHELNDEAMAPHAASQIGPQGVGFGSPVPASVASSSSDRGSVITRRS